MTDKDIMNLMNGIDYGIDNIDNYMLQSPKQLLKSKRGLCWDQVELERYYFEKNNYRIKTFFVIGNSGINFHTHTFLVYRKDNLLYWFEHSWKKYHGIHEYKNINKLLNDIKKKFSIFYNLNEENISVFEYDKPKYDIFSNEFIHYCQNGKLVLDRKIIQNKIDKIHTTDMGIDRIKRHLKINNNVLDFIMKLIMNDNIYLYKKGKNYYVEINNTKITINSYNYSIITAHIIN